MLDHPDELLLAGKTPAVIAFPFQDTPEAFHRAVINTVRHTGHTLRHSGLYELLVECSACVLVTSVTVEQRMCVRVELNSPVKGLEYERIVIALTQRIGYDAPVTEIQNSAQIELMYLNTLIPFELRHIREPLFVGLCSVELSVQKILGNILGIFGLPGTAMIVVFHSRPYISGPADPQHSLVIDMDTMIMAKIIIEPSVAFVRAFFVDLFNRVGQTLIFCSPTA